MGANGSRVSTSTQHSYALMPGSVNQRQCIKLKAKKKQREIKISTFQLTCGANSTANWKCLKPFNIHAHTLIRRLGERQRDRERAEGKRQTSNDEDEAITQKSIRVETIVSPLTALQVCLSIWFRIRFFVFWRAFFSLFILAAAISFIV